MKIQSGSANYNFKRFIDDVYLFNDIANQARGVKKVSYKDLRNQYKVILEEVKETGEAIEQQDLVKILDGVVDTMVTTLGMVQQLESLGINVLGACQRVANDNLEKYPTRSSVALDTQQSYNSQGVVTKVKEVEAFNETYYVILDVNNKVRKPSGFVGTNLGSYVPKDLEIE